MEVEGTAKFRMILGGRFASPSRVAMMPETPDEAASQSLRASRYSRWARSRAVR